MTSNAGARTSRVWGLITLLAACALTSVAYAHHSFIGNYSPDDEVTVTGEVTDFQFRNPHGLLELNVTTEEGIEEKWTGVLNHPGMLQRHHGWTRDSLKPGDIVTITGARARNGSNAMRVTALQREGSEKIHYSIAD